MDAIKAFIRRQMPLRVNLFEKTKKEKKVKKKKENENHKNNIT